MHPGRAPGLRVAVAACSVILCLFAAVLVWIGLRAVAAKEALEDLAAIAADLPTAAGSGDLDALDALVARLAAQAAVARTVTDDPLWPLAESMPFFGSNFFAVRTIAVQVDALSAEAAAPVLHLARQARDSAQGAGGAPDADTGGTALVDLALVESAGVPLERAAHAVDRARDRLAQVPRDGLAAPVGAAVDTLLEAVTVAAPAARGVADAAGVLPRILGADRPRSVLVMIQNNAELRTSGGITGSFALLETDAGRIELVDQADSGDFADLPTPILPIPASTTALYGDVVGRYVQNASMPADFDLTGRLAAAWWAQRTGHAPDLILSVDPFVVRELLASTGPAPLADGTELSADTLVQRLLIDPYMTMDTDQQSVFLRMATDGLFTHLLTRGIDPVAWARALAGPLEQGRISLWAADAGEQSVLRRTALGGPAARHGAAGENAFAVYLNDATGGKMDTFLSVDISVGVLTCRPDGLPEVTVRLTMASTAPADAGELLPWSMTGGGVLGTGSGDIGTSVSVSAPPGMFFGGVRKNGEPDVSVDVVDAGFPTSLVRVNLSPAEVNTLDFRFIAESARPVEPRIVHTPLVNGPGAGGTHSLACG